MQTLTRSGAGLLIERERVVGPGRDARLRQLVRAHRFVVVKRAAETVEQAIGWMEGFGHLNVAPARPTGAVLVEDRESPEVFRSSHALPLHKDGILTGFDVGFVGIFCVEFRAIDRGRTFVCDATSARDALSEELLTSLRQHGMEATAVDTNGYYEDRYRGRWQRFPAFKARPGGEPTLNIGLPHAAGEPESWRVRVPGLEQPRSDRILSGLCRTLLAQEHLYFHDWSEGDLLIMDNYAVMHGRESFEGRARTLANIQVLEPAD